MFDKELKNNCMSERTVRIGKRGSTKVSKAVIWCCRGSEMMNRVLGMSVRGHSSGKFGLGCRAWARFGGGRDISGILDKFGHI